jgi:hypothetical protein
MAFEEIWAPFVVMLLWAVFLFPAVYVLDMIRQKADPQTAGRKFLLILMMSYLIAMASYPLAISEEFLPFNSATGSYAMAVLFIFAIYLVVFNKTKDD